MQIKMNHFTEDEATAALLIAGNLNAEGYLDATVEVLAEESGLGADFITEVLEEVQEMDPPGVAARDLRECLAAQARVLGTTDPLLLSIIDSHLDALEKRNFTGIAKALGELWKRCWKSPRSS